MKITDLEKQWDAVQIGCFAEYSEQTINFAFRRYKGRNVTGEIIYAVKPFETLSGAFLHELDPDMTEDETRLQVVSGAFRVILKTDSGEYEIISLCPDFLESGQQIFSVTEKAESGDYNYLGMLRAEREARDCEFYAARNGYAATGYGNTL